MIMTTTSYTVQCKDSISGDIGCFLFDGDDADTNRFFTATSPVFQCLIELFDYARDNKIDLDHRPYNFPRTDYD